MAMVTETKEPNTKEPDASECTLTVVVVGERGRGLSNAEADIAIMIGLPWLCC